MIMMLFDNVEVGVMPKRWNGSVMENVSDSVQVDQNKYKCLKFSPQLSFRSVSATVETKREQVKPTTN